MNEAIRYEAGQDRIVVLTIDMPGQSANTMNAVYGAAMAGCVTRLLAEKDSIAGVIITNVADAVGYRLDFAPSEQGGALALGKIERTQAIDLAAIAEEQQVGMRRGEDDVPHDVVGLQLRPADALAAASLLLPACASSAMRRASSTRSSTSSRSKAT